MKAWKRILLSLILALSLSSTGIQAVQAETSGQSTEQFANLVLFVQFSDTTGNFMDTVSNNSKQTTYTENAVRDYLDTTYPKSLVSYMDTISYGQFHVNTFMPQLSGGKITPITLSNTRASYDSWSNIYSAEKEALDLAKKNFGIDSKNYDLNGDTYVDNVTFIFAGDEDQRGNALYAHKTDFGAGYTIDGKDVGCINVLMANTILQEDFYSTGEIAHEFMHSLGYPDLYDEGGENPVGPWDLMSSASVFNQWPLAYMRASVSNWLTISTVSSSSHLTLNKASDVHGNQAYILKTPISENEFFVVEYRKQGTRYSNELDVKIPGSGLIIYRINKNVERLNNRNTGDDGVYVFRSGETSVHSSEEGAMLNSYLSSESGRTLYGSLDMTKTIADNAIVYSSGQNSGIVISNVGSASGDTISFDVTFADTANAGSWNSLGGTSVIGSEVTAADMAVNGSAQYPSLLLGSLYSSIAVYDYNGTSWAKSTADITDIGNNASLAYYGGVPYILYSTNNGDLLKLVRYSSGSWVTVKSDFSSAQVNKLALKVYGDQIYIAWNQGTGSQYSTYAARYDGTNYAVKEMGTSANYNSLKISASSAGVYLSCRDVDHNDMVYVYQYLNDSLVAMNGPGLGYSSPEIYTDGTNMYLLGADGWSTRDTKVYQYDSTGALTALGTNTIAAYASNTASITSYQNVPLIQTISQVSSKYNTIVWRYADGKWIQEGLPVLVGSNADHTAMTMIGDTCYVLATDSNVPYVKAKRSP